MASSAVKKFAGLRPTWWQTVIRVKDPKLTLPFYSKHFNMTLIDVMDFPNMKFSVYTMATLPPDNSYTIKPGTQEAHDFKWRMTGTSIEFVYNYGTESDDTKYHIGNADSHGFGHIAFNVEDVYAACEILDKNGVSFKKKPDEGRMKGLAFALDPDGYWIEVVKRSEGCGWPGFNLSQTMLRIKDPEASLKFYKDVLGMTLISQSDLGVGTDWGFSLYFLGYGEEGKRPGQRFNPVLELTHNHGTEKDDSFAYLTGEAPGSGYSHLGILVDDVYTASEALEEAGFDFFKKPDDGKMKGVAMVKDPDGYKIEIVKRGGANGVHALTDASTKIYGMD